MNRVLVTGGAGYIGSHACKALSKAGFSPVTYDNLVNGHAYAVKWGPLERGDILDRERIRTVLTQYKPLAIMHFAAHAYVGESMADPSKYYRANCLGTLNLLDAAVEADVPHFVFSSSCATYGIPESDRIAETTLQEPVNPYGASKLFAERMIADMARAHNLTWIGLRYFNAAGADPDGEAGEDHDPETRIIPLALAAADHGRTPFSIFGDDYNTPDGTCIRDYIHVTDLANGHVSALKALLAGKEPAFVNLGSGVGHSVREVIHTIEKVTGRTVPIRISPRRPGDPARLVADPALAQRLFGWSATFSDLENIVGSAWKWHIHKKNESRQCFAT